MDAQQPVHQGSWCGSGPGEGMVGSLLVRGDRLHAQSPGFVRSRGSRDTLVASDDSRWADLGSRLLRMVDRRWTPGPGPGRCLSRVAGSCPRRRGGSSGGGVRFGGRGDGSHRPGPRSCGLAGFGGRAASTPLFRGRPRPSPPGEGQLVVPRDHSVGGGSGCEVRPNGHAG